MDANFDDLQAAGPQPDDSLAGTVCELLRQGIAAAKAKDQDRARQLLLRVVELDEENVSGWMWLSSVVDELQDREVCLENVLALAPGNQAARRGLDWVRSEIQKAPALADDIEDQGIVPLPPPLFDDPAPAPPTPLSKTASPSFTDIPPASTAKTVWDHPLDPFTCPYCAAPTQEQDRVCPECNGKLLVHVRRREEHSWWLMNVLVVQLATAVFSAIAPFAVFTFIMYRLNDSFDPFPLVPVYLGLPSDIPAEIASAALDMVPRHYILPFLAYALYSIAMLLGTYLRWKPVFYLLLGGAGLRMALAIGGIALGRYYTLVCGGTGALFTLISFFIIFQLEDDFLGEKERIYFSTGRKSTGGMTLLAQGRSYAKQNMWALAVLHYRAGIAQLPNQIAGYTGLATAYLHLDQFALAQDTIQQAQTIESDHPRLQELTALIEQQRPGIEPS